MRISSFSCLVVSYDRFNSFISSNITCFNTKAHSLNVSLWDLSIKKKLSPFEIVSINIYCAKSIWCHFGFSPCELYILCKLLFTHSQNTSHFDSHADGKCWNNHVMGITTLCRANERIEEITWPSNEYSMKAIGKGAKIAHGQMTNSQAKETGLNFLYVGIKNNGKSLGVLSLSPKYFNRFDCKHFKLIRMAPI